MNFNWQRDMIYNESCYEALTVKKVFAVYILRGICNKIMI